MKEKKGVIEPHRFIASMGICMAIMLMGIIEPTKTNLLFNGILTFVLENMDWTYLLAVATFIIFSVAIAASKYGKIKLGKDDEEAEFSFGSWLAMLFSAGMGIGLVFFSVAEPMQHFLDPAFSTPETKEAAAEAIYYTMFHWGIHPWAVFCIMGMALAYFQFRKGYNGMPSSIFIPLIGEKIAKGLVGKSIDVYAVVMTVLGVSASFGLGATQLKTGLNIVYGTPNSDMMTFGIIILCTLFFTYSAVKGIDKGIKVLSDTNMKIAFFLMCFILLTGPTSYIIKSFIDGIGNYLSNILKLTFFSDAQGIVREHTGYNWVGNWTVFYWAWWLSWAPFVGSFIARISKGRTIREFVTGMLIFPTLLCCIWFAILGGTGIFFEMNGIIPLKEVIAADSTGAVFEVLKALPLTGVISTITMISLIIFFVTSADAATYVVSVITSGGNINPNTKVRVFWGFLMGGVSIMFVITGGIKSVQNLIIAVSFPFLILMVLMIVSVIKDLKSPAVDVKTIEKIEHKDSVLSN